MTLANDEILKLLESEFVLGWTNIQKEEHVGMSHGYRCTQTAVGTTNGAGGRNVQLVVLAPDETVLHVMPGFWHPDDLAAELRFARRVHRLWLDPDLDRAQKERMFDRMHAVHERGLSSDTLARSQWQSFDRAYELGRYRSEPRDAVVLDADGQPQVRPLCLLVHERMRARPFRKLDEFDMESFVDYGRPFYDNNMGLDDGRPFHAAERANKARQKAEAAREHELAKGQ
ncbi:MAG: hypothetical protein AB7O97_14565 [Planctomycetota bacterium]